MYKKWHFVLFFLLYNFIFLLFIYKLNLIVHILIKNKSIIRFYYLFQINSVLKFSFDLFCAYKKYLDLYKKYFTC